MDSSHHRQQSFRMAGCITVFGKTQFFRVGSLDREKADPVFPKWQETDAFIEHVEIQFLSQGICSLNIRRVQRNMVDGTRVSHSATIFIASIIRLPS